MLAIIWKLSMRFKDNLSRVLLIYIWIKTLLPLQNLRMQIVFRTFKQSLNLYWNFVKCTEFWTFYKSKIRIDTHRSISAWRALLAKSFFRFKLLPLAGGFVLSFPSCFSQRVVLIYGFVRVFGWYLGFHKNSASH